MAERHKIRRKLIRIGLVTCLLILSFWIYEQFLIYTRNTEVSRQLTEDVLENNFFLVKQYEEELHLTQEVLKKTEGVVGQLELENEKLRERVKLLDTVSELEATIARLKEKNALLVNHIGSMETPPPPKAFDISEILSMDEAKKQLDKFQTFVKDIKTKIKQFKKQEFEEKVAAFKEMDRKKLMLGNNGYVMREGEWMKMDMPCPLANQDIKIDVKFVK